MIEKIQDKKLFLLKMNKVINILKKENVELEKLNAIELFGGTGKTDSIISHHFKSFEIWEIDEEVKEQLNKNVGNAKIIFCDSIKRLESSEKLSKFDLIILDNPMSMFGERNCEHFDIIKNVGKLIDDEAILVFLVNKKPFFYNKLRVKNELWKKRRKEFYGNMDITNLSTEFLMSFYRELFLNMGFDTIFSKSISRHKPHLDYFVFKIKKKIETRKIIRNQIDWISLIPLLTRKID